MDSAGVRPQPVAQDRGRLRIQDCTRCFAGAGGDEIRAIDGLTLDVPPGQVVTIVGSNGAGKSTLLSLVAGSVLVDSGRILIDEADQTFQPSWMPRISRPARTAEPG